MIHVINKTVWQTRDLKRVFHAVLRENIKHEGPLKHHLRVTIVHSRRARWHWGYSGCAYLNSGTMRLRLPMPKYGIDAQIDVLKLAFIFEHELAHCRGYGHDKMLGLNSWKQATADRYPYVVGMTVAAKPAPAAKPKTDVQVVRYRRVMTRLDDNRRVAKRLAKAIKKLEARRRYYEKALAADGRLAAMRMP